MSASSEPREPQRPTDDEQTSGGQNPPSKIARLSSDPDAEETVTMAAPSPLGLGLGLGLCLGPADSATAAKPPFTFMQMQELEQQAVIYKYMVSGLPVPLHLVFPIWKSVAASACAGSLCCPSFLGSGGPLRFDYRNSLEPEPGRCRRTDGKKWRCSRDVVPDQKYCERHMHRGRNRSRKPVEAGGGGVPAAAAASGLQLMPAAHHRNSSSSVTSVLRGNAAAAGSCNAGR